MYANILPKLGWYISRSPEPILALVYQCGLVDNNMVIGKANDLVVAKKDLTFAALFAIREDS